MTRRDHQNKAKETRRPWDTSKDVEQSAVVTPLRLMADVPSVGAGRIHLEQNGETKQDADLSQMVWSVPEIIADLSGMYTLRQGDVVFMGTPAGRPVQRGDVLTGGVDGIADFEGRSSTPATHENRRRRAQSRRRFLLQVGKGVGKPPIALVRRARRQAMLNLMQSSPSGPKLCPALGQADIPDP